MASLAARLTVHLGPAPARVLAGYLALDRGPTDPAERLGRWLLRRLLGLASFLDIELNRRWLALVGVAPSLPATLGLAALLALGGILLALTSGMPLSALLVGAGAIYPFARLRSQANRVRRQVERALPELAAAQASNRPLLGRDDAPGVLVRYVGVGVLVNDDRTDHPRVYETVDRIGAWLGKDD